MASLPPEQRYSPRLVGKGLSDATKWLVYDVNTEEADRNLWRAAKDGNLAVVELLVSQGITVEKMNEFALVPAVVREHFDIVKFLVEKGADVQMAICPALNSGNVMIAEYLIKYGADIRPSMDMALYWSIVYDHRYMVKFLVEHGAIYPKDAPYLPPRDITACRYPRYLYPNWRR